MASYYYILATYIDIVTSFVMFTCTKLYTYPSQSATYVALYIATIYSVTNWKFHGTTKNFNCEFPSQLARKQSHLSQSL